MSLRASFCALVLLWSFVGLADAQSAPDKKPSTSGATFIDVLTQGIGNLTTHLKADKGQKVHVDESSYFTSSLDMVVTQPSFPEALLDKAPASRIAPLRLPSTADRWQGRLKEWKRHFLERYPLSVPVDQLNPCGLAGEIDPRLNRQGGYSGISMTFNGQQNYLHDFAEQGLPALFDDVTLVDPSTGKVWTPPASLELQHKDGEQLRLVIDPKAGGNIGVRVGYSSHLGSYLGGSSTWARLPYSQLRITKNVRQAPKDLTQPYPPGFFRSQETFYISPDSTDGGITDLEALSLFFSRQDAAIIDFRGNPQRLTLGATALVAGHALQALKVMIPVPHYHRYAKLPTSYLQYLGGVFKGIHRDYVAVGEEIGATELATLAKSTPVLTTYETKVLCLKSARFNPAWTERSWAKTAH